MPRRYRVGGVLLLAGAALLASALWPEQDLWQIKRTPLTIPADLSSHYPPTGFERLEIRHAKTDQRLVFHLACYRDQRGAPRQALLPEPGSHKWQSWMELGKLLRALEPEALLLAWWDDGQRIDFFSGRTVWVSQPPAEAFAPAERPLWQAVSGGFGDPSGRSRQLAKWLTASGKAASEEIAQLLPNTPLYLLVSSDNLAHGNEIERLAGRKLPLEVRIFPATGSFHSQIAAVQRWAQETGGYLPQKVPAGIAAWRITQNRAEPLLVLLLPFTTSLGKPLPQLVQVYRSSDGYLTLYRRP